MPGLLFWRESKREKIRRLSKQLAQAKFDVSPEAMAIEQALRDLIASFDEGVERRNANVYFSRKRRKYADKIRTAALKSLEEEAANLAHISDEAKDVEELNREIEVTRRLIELNSELIEDESLVSNSQATSKIKKSNREINKIVAQYSNRIADLAALQEYIDTERRRSESFKSANYDLNKITDSTKDLSQISSDYNKYAREVEKPNPQLNRDDYVKVFKQRLEAKKNPIFKEIKGSFRKRIFRSSFNPLQFIESISKLSDEIALRELKLFPFKKLDSGKINSLYSIGLKQLLRNLSEHKLQKLYNFFIRPECINLYKTSIFLTDNYGAVNLNEFKTNSDYEIILVQCLTTVFNRVSNAFKALSEVLKEKGLVFDEKKLEPEYRLIKESELSNSNRAAIIKYVRKIMPEQFQVQQTRRELARKISESKLLESQCNLEASKANAVVSTVELVSH